MTRDERRNSGSEWARTWKMRYNDAMSAWPLIDALDECLTFLGSIEDSTTTLDGIHEMVEKIKEKFPI